MKKIALTLVPGRYVHGELITLMQDVRGVAGVVDATCTCTIDHKDPKVCVIDDNNIMAAFIDNSTSDVDAVALARRLGAFTFIESVYLQIL